MTTPKSIRVSVIIPCYNDGEFLEEAIAENDEIVSEQSFQATTHKVIFISSVAP